MKMLARVAALATAGLLVGMPAQAQQEIKITVCAGQAPVLSFVRLITQSFIPTVNAELAKTNKLKITWNEAYGGTLAKIGGELEAIQQGVCDMGSVGTVFHPAKMPLQQVTFMAPFGSSDFKSVLKVMNRLNREHPAMVQAWERQNQVFLAYTAVDDYALFTNFPVNRHEDLRGKKIGSSPIPLSWLQGTGATGVSAGLPSYYNDVKAGVYEGVLTFLTAAAPIKLFEVAPNYVQTGLGATAPGGLSINKRVWDRLGPEGQAAFRAAADAYAVAYIESTERSMVSAEAALKAGGGNVTALSQEERLRWAQTMVNPAKPWIARNGPAAQEVLKAYMDAMRAEGVTFLRDWDKE